MSSLHELLVKYPFSRRGFYFRAIVVALSTMLSLYLLFNTQLLRFVISFIVGLPSTFGAITLYKITKFKKVLKYVSKDGKYLERRRSEERYYRFLARILLLTILPLILPLIIDPVIALGIILSVICGYLFSEIMHYAYVLNEERRLGGRLYYFITEVGPDGYYYSGIRLVMDLEE